MKPFEYALAGLILLCLIYGLVVGAGYLLHQLVMLSALP